MKAQLLIVAAGLGSRLGATVPKALIELGGKTLLARTLERFVPTGLFDHPVVVVAPADSNAVFRQLVCACQPRTKFCVVAGGAERQISVAKGLAALDPDTDIVAVHDAARPFVTAHSIRESIAAADAWGASTVAVPCVDTILVGDNEEFLRDTPERASLWACQTPQVFRVPVLLAAHERAGTDAFTGTDDASLVRRLGQPVKLVMGSPLNFKITTPVDLALAEAIIERGLV